MSKDMKIMFVVLLACLGGACLAETEADVSPSANEDLLAYAAPPPNPLDESINAVTGLA